MNINDAGDEAVPLQKTKRGTGEQLLTQRSPESVRNPVGKLGIPDQDGLLARDARLCSKNRRFGAVGALVLSPLESSTSAATLVSQSPLLIAMTIEIPKAANTTAVASIQRYFLENRDEEIGSLEAGALLGFFLKEIGPVIYNQAVSDAQARMQARIMELDIEVHEDEFTYWDQKKRK